MTGKDIPSAPGTYILLVELSSPAEIEVGRLGTISFDNGIFVAE